ncbi:hypothetical protein PPYR_06147 [Photinus pyralis]|uniref:Uncharacterized protein n=1 Tax=Photinus pyralis TaxID=7054 RepID=A0A5N4ASV9_PHOPY|nr:uncharacterized protein LOC116166525 [Photinus pyralis]KAB0800407.1 hypothetical protein PPYR_06147 [Photinus pyralis]
MISHSNFRYNRYSTIARVQKQWHSTSVSNTVIRRHVNAKNEIITFNLIFLRSDSDTEGDDDFQPLPYVNFDTSDSEAEGDSEAVNNNNNVPPPPTSSPIPREYLYNDW